MKLQSKLSLIVAPLVLTPLAFFGWFAARELSHIGTQRGLDALHSSMERHRRDFEGLRQTAAGNLELLRESPVLRSYLLTEDETQRLTLMQPNLLRHLAAVHRAYPAFQDVHVLLTNGVVDAISPPPAVGSRPRDTAEAYFPALRQRDTDEPWPLVRQHPDTGAWCLLVAGRVSLADRASDPGLARRTTRGYLGIHVALDLFAGNLYGQHLGERGGFLLADDQGRPLMVPRESDRVAPWGVAPIKVKTVLPHGEAGLVHLEGQAPFYAQAAELLPGLTLVAYLPETDVLAATRRLAIVVAGLTILSILFTLLFMFLALRRHVFRPVRVLSRAAEEIGRGTLHIPIAFRSTDELGQLGRAFDRMRVNLMENRDAIEAYQRQLEEKVLAAQAANAAKSQFLANMSHEIRTPINGVMGMLHLLRRTVSEATQRRYVDTALGSADTLMTVIGDVLDFSKIEAGRFELDIASFGLYDAIDATVRLFAARAEGKGLELAYWIAPEVPDRMMGDANRLRQILANLLNNAVKFTDRGEIFIQCSVEERDEKGVLLRFRVRDTGPGIPLVQREKIFESFSQGDESMNRRHGGTGLGLAISRHLVRLMQGQMGVDSVVGQGATFWFTVRLECDHAQSPLRQRRALSLSGLRVLVVDDAAAARSVVRDYTAAWGCEPSEASSLAQAEQAVSAAAAPFDIILVDMGLLGGDPTAAAHLARHAPGMVQPKLIFLHTFSGRQGLELGTHAMPDGPTKPIRASDLYNAISNAIHTSVVLPPLPAPAPAAAADPALSGLRILLAEDNEVNQEVARETLKSLGYSCACVGTGAEAVAQAKTGEFHLLLMDCQMPVMDGYEATRQIRDWEKTQDPEGHRRPLPIIALTAHALSGDRERCTAAGMSDYLTKPVQPERLAFVLNAWLQHHRSASPSPRAPAAAPPPELDPAEQAVLRQCMGNRELAGRLLLKFIEQTELDIRASADACARGDAAALAAAAHRVKGAAASLGLDVPRAAAHALEQLGRSGRVAGAEPHIKAIGDSLKTVAAMSLLRSREPGKEVPA